MTPIVSRVALAIALIPGALMARPAHATALLGFQVTATQAGDPINPTPNITGLNPATVTTWPDEMLVAVLGGGFVSGTKVRVNGQDRMTLFISQREVRVRMGASDKATVGTRAITAFNPAPGGGLSNAVTLDVVNPAPQGVTLSPSSIAAGTADGVLLTVTGAAFVDGARVLFGSRELTPTSVQWNRIEVRVPADEIAVPGTVQVVVTNPAPGGGSSTPRPFSVNPAPLEVDPLPEIAFSYGEAMLREGTSARSADRARLRVTRRANLTPALTIPYSVGGTAVPGVDYRALSGSVTIPAGDSITLFVVETIPNTILEADRTVILELQPGAAYQLASPARFVATIADDDPFAGSLGLSALQPLREGLAGAQAAAELYVDWAEAPPGVTPPASITVNYAVGGTATAGADYVALPGAVTVPYGQTTTRINVTILEDAEADPDETIILTLQAGAGYALTRFRSTDVTLVIQDSPPAPPPSQVVRFTTTSLQVLEADAPRTFNFLVQRRTAQGQFATSGEIAVPFTLSGTATRNVDYDFVASSPFVLLDGNSQFDLHIIVRPDAEFEPTETIVVRLEDGAGYALDPAARELRIDIIDDDDPAAQPPPPEPLATVFFEHSRIEMREGDAAALAAVLRAIDGAPARGRTINVPFSLSGTASPGTDYHVIPQNVAEFGFGNNIAHLIIELVQDDSVEPPESIIVRLEEGTGYVLDPARRELRIDIVDDDVAPATPPQLARLDPASAQRGDGSFDLELEGSGFVAGSVVRWAGSALQTTMISPTRLRAAVSAERLAAAATVPINVAAPDGQLSAELTFDILNPTPNLSAVLPASAQAGATSLEINLRGQRFLPDLGPGQPGSTVLWNGQERAVTFVRPTELRIQLDVADLASAGVATIAVRNPGPGGGTSAPASFQIQPAATHNPVPTLTVMSPDSARRGGAVTMTFLGADFVEGARVLWGGTPVAATFVSSTELRAVIPSPFIASARDDTILVTVENPAPGGGTSAALTFRIVRPR